MSGVKLTWRVSPAPTGRYRSFERREWPSAFYSNDRIAFAIRCEDEYVPRNVRTGEHAELTLLVAVYSDKSFDWKRGVVKYATLPELKAGAAALLARKPRIMPPELWPRLENPL